VDNNTHSKKSFIPLFIIVLFFAASIFNRQPESQVKSENVSLPTATPSPITIPTVYTYPTKAIQPQLESVNEITNDNQESYYINDDSDGDTPDTDTYPTYKRSNSYNSGASDEKTLRYNSLEGNWEYATDDESLRYNAIEDDWEYVEDDESTRYNAMEDEWEFSSDDENLQYNAMEDTWQYAPDDSTTRYNAMEDRWEITDSDSSLRYNAMDDEWGYE
jgi:hypothetical protein